MPAGGGQRPEPDAADPARAMPNTRQGSPNSAKPRRQRAVLVLRYYEGLFRPRISRRLLGYGSGTVRVDASRALAALRVEMAGPAPRQSVAVKEES